MKPSKKYATMQTLMQLLFHRIRKPDGSVWSNADVHNATGIHYATLKALRSGVTENPGIEAVRRLAEFFEIPLAYFASSTEDEANGILTDALHPASLEQRTSDLDRLALRIARLSPDSRRVVEATLERFEVADRIRPEDQPEPPLVLICDDDDANRFVLGGSLNYHRFPYIECENGEEAFQLIQTKPIDIAFIDLRMPGLSGHDLARAIRETQLNHQALLIAYTAYAVTPEQREEIFAAGFDAIVEKPLEPDKFLMQLDRIRRHHRQRTDSSG